MNATSTKIIIIIIASLKERADFNSLSTTFINANLGKCIEQIQI